MKLKSFGCSFIYGSDLSDCLHGENQPHPGPSRLSWPALLAKHLNFEYFCHAWPAVGNMKIMERILYEMTDPDPSLYVISWTWIDRFDYLENHTHPWKNFSWKSILPNDQTDFAREYFSIYHSQIKDQLTNVIYINQIIQLLKEKRIPFIMTYLDRLILDNQYHDHPGLKEMQNKIKPYMTLFDNLTFLEWSRSRGFMISEKMHPLDNAHSQAAELILPSVTANLRTLNKIL